MLCTLDDAIQFLHDAAEQTITKQAPDGSLAPGHNGPHGDRETPVRNTAHWLYTLCWLVEHGQNRWKTAANLAADFLISESARSGNHSFLCRLESGKDTSNGLIGQAWVLESLLKASEILCRDDCNRVAVEVYYHHKWSNSHSAWHTVLSDGTTGTVCETFNQQLWFASIACQLNDQNATALANNFLSKVVPRLSTYEDGVIFHDSVAHCGSGFFRRIGRLATRRVKMKTQRLRSVGYHAFNLVAMTQLKAHLPNSQFWASKKYQEISNACFSSTFKRDCLNNKYAFSYNPIGFEMAFVLAEQGFYQDARAFLNLQRDFISTYPEIQVLGSFDQNTSLARLYELCRVNLLMPTEQ